MNKAQISIWIDEFLKDNSLENIKDLDRSNLIELCERFSNTIIIKDKTFLGLDGFLTYKFGILLNKAVKNPNDEESVKDVENFLNYTKKFLGFKEDNGGFKLIEEDE